jgi:NADH:ubiquinone oxidoreductase subunit F (NADH-binding)
VLEGASLPRVLAGWHPRRAIGLEEHLAAHGPVPVPGRRERRREVIAMVERSGLAGRGGAGFATGAKLRAVADGGRGRRIVVANGAEGEPASRKDGLLLAEAPHLVLDGAVIAAGAVGASEAIVCLKGGASRELEAVELAIAERGSRDRVALSLVEIPPTFLAGEESALVNHLNAGRAIPTFVPPRPFERGVDGTPTLVQNVETLAHLALIARHGAEWFRGVGTPEDPGSNLVTLGGAVAKPGVYEVPGGISLGSLIEHAGGATAPLQALLVGGYAGTWFAADRASDIRLGHAALRSHGAGLGAGVVVALPASACGVCESARVARFLAEESAGQCGPCLHGLGSIADALEDISVGRCDTGAHLWVSKWAKEIAGRGACGHPDGAVRFVGSAMSVFRDAVARHESAEPCSVSAHGPWVLPLPEPTGVR